MNTETSVANQERQVKVLNGWLMLPAVILLLIGGVALFIYSIAAGVKAVDHPFWGLFVAGLLVEFVGIVMTVGFFTLQPNRHGC